MICTYNTFQNRVSSYPIFKKGEDIIIFDIDGIYLKGREYLSRSKEIFQMAKKEIKRVVLWSVGNYALDLYSVSPFSSADLKIIGFELSSQGTPVKDFRDFSKDLRSIVAIEDDRFFSPQERVVNIKNFKGNLMAAYIAAREKLGSA